MMAEHSVWIWDEAYIVNVEQKSERVWVATGEYKGELIAVEDGSEAAALQRWHDLARSRGG